MSAPTDTPLPNVAQQGFGDAAAYDTHRPSYSATATDALISRLRLDDGARIVEVAAGTGKFTEQLANRQERFLIRAVEPHDGMRARLAAKDLPAVETVAGKADAMPVDDEWADACIAAQSFHWFATPEALREIHRVLRPGAVFGMVWNVDDYNQPASWTTTTKWEQKLKDYVLSFQDGHPRFRDEQWKEVFEKQLPGNPVQALKDTLMDHLPRFSLPLGEESHKFTAWLSDEALWARLRTLSQVAVLEGAELQVARRIFDEALAMDDVERNGSGEIAVHGNTYMAWTDRL